MSLDQSSPETPLAISAHHEQEWLDNKYPNSYEADFCKNQARHLHFTWNTATLVLRPCGSEGNLPEVKVGDARFSKEGVRYTQLYSHNPKEWVFEVDEGQFSKEVFEPREGYSEPQLIYNS